MIQKAIMEGKIPLEIAAYFRPSTVFQLKKQFTTYQLQGTLNHGLGQLKTLSDYISIHFNRVNLKPAPLEIKRLKQQRDVPKLRTMIN